MQKHCSWGCFVRGSPGCGNPSPTSIRSAAQKPVSRTPACPPGPCPCWRSLSRLQRLTGLPPPCHQHDMNASEVF